MQRELLTPPKVTPSTLDQGCVWLEEMQHRLNLCMKTGQLGTSKDYHHICAGGPQWHYSLLLHSGQYMGYSISEASATRIESHPRQSLCDACRVPH